MKRTKNMYYKRTEESRELLLCAENDGRIYNRSIRPIILNLQKKVKKGIFDKERAVDAFYPVMCEVSKQYKIDFGYLFTVQERFTAACDMLENFMEEIMEVA